MTTPDKTPSEVFAVDLAALAREIAMDIFDLPQILELHRLTDEEWEKIRETPKFNSMLKQMTADWNSASNTVERVRVKSATGLESVLETYIRDIADPDIPLAQRVEAGKFLARLGELGPELVAGGGGGAFSITLNIGSTHNRVDVERRPTLELERADAE